MSCSIVRAPVCAGLVDDDLSAFLRVDVVETGAAVLAVAEAASDIHVSGAGAVVALPTSAIPDLDDDVASMSINLDPCYQAERGRKRLFHHFLK